MKTKTYINIKKGLKAATVLAAGIAAILPVANSYAWGPERQTYTMKSPADHVQFNSITDNTTIGDERDFVRVAEVTGDGKYTWVNTLAVEPGKDYMVMIYYHNNAASNLNSRGTGMATNARVMAKFPESVTKDARGEVYAQITADNASPSAVWDEAYFTTNSNQAVALRYVTASAKLYNQGAANGTTLSNTALFSSRGQLLGYNQLIGNLPGCSEYSGQVVYTLRATQAGATVSKTVSMDGVNFRESVTAQVGDTLTYRVEFKNSGSEDLTNVTFRDTLPAGVSLVPGTTKLVNAANPNGVVMSDIIGEAGFSVGTYTIGATATLTYQVKVNEDLFAADTCGTKDLKNLIHVGYDGGEVTDDSSIVVSKVCDKGDTPVTPDDPDTPDELPKTGPGEIIFAIVAIICITTGVAYWYHSQKEVAKITKKVSGKSSKK